MKKLYMIQKKKNPMVEWPEIILGAKKKQGNIPKEILLGFGERVIVNQTKGNGKISGKEYFSVKSQSEEKCRAL